MFLPIRDDNPHTITPYVNYGLIAACALAFLWQLSLGEESGQAAVLAFGLIPGRLFGTITLESNPSSVPAILTIFTSMFLHGGWMHFLGNMLYLWIFGDNIEASLGHKRYLAFYLLCGVAAALGQSIAVPSSDIPMIGASGAIAGVLGAYLLLYPRAKVLVLIPLGIFSQLVRIPALFVLGFWFLLQFVQQAMTSAVAGGQGGVAYWAHIGGFVAGAILILLMRRRGIGLFHRAQPHVSGERIEGPLYRRNSRIPDSGSGSHRRGPWA